MTLGQRERSALQHRHRAQRPAFIGQGVCFTIPAPRYDGGGGGRGQLNCSGVISAKKVSVSSRPTVTVILPTYNWATVLPYAIGSVLRQTFTDFELLVVGDHCTDESENVVQSISDPRLQWTNLASNAGHQYAPNNEGLSRARGSVIAYLGHDDLWLPHYLESQLETLDRGADLAFSLVELILPNDAGISAVPRTRSYRRGMWHPPTGTVHRKRLTDTVGGWRPPLELAVDPECDLWARGYDAGFRAGFTPRLGAIKFPAAKRKDVYRTRPCHEQAQWTDRIIREAAFEARELARIATARPKPRETNPPPPPGGAVRNRIGRLLRDPLIPLRWAADRARRKINRLPAVRLRRQRDRIRSRRAYKGLDPTKTN